MEPARFPHEEGTIEGDLKGKQRIEKTLLRKSRTFDSIISCKNIEYAISLNKVMNTEKPIPLLKKSAIASAFHVYHQSGATSYDSIITF